MQSEVWLQKSKQTGQEGLTGLAHECSQVGPAAVMQAMQTDPVMPIAREKRRRARHEAGEAARPPTISQWTGETRGQVQQ